MKSDGRTFFLRPTSFTYLICLLLGSRFIKKRLEIGPSSPSPGLFKVEISILVTCRSTSRSKRSEMVFYFFDLINLFFWITGRIGLEIFKTLFIFLCDVRNYSISRIPLRASKGGSHSCNTYNRRYMPYLFSLMAILPVKLCETASHLKHPFKGWKRLGCRGEYGSELCQVKHFLLSERW